MFIRIWLQLCFVFGALVSTGICQSAGSAGSAVEASLNATAYPLQGGRSGIARLLASAGESRVVLLGEASHGTHEFYVWRNRLTRELVESGHVAFVAIEGDTATLAPLDRYVRDAPGAPTSARAALAGITHWPSWVWANVELAEFAEWLRQFNRPRPYAQRVAIHGLDLYAISDALNALQTFYRRHAPLALPPVQRLSRSFWPFRTQPSAYADTVWNTGRTLRPAALDIVQDLSERYRRSTPEQRDLVFAALQHARAVAAGLAYLEAMPGPPTWAANLRSRHFAQTLRRLLEHSGVSSRGIVWAHNTHVGDARATDGRFIGELSLGQLVRQGLGDQAVYIVGFGTGAGEVLAARRWGGQCEILPTPAPRSDSLEAAVLAAGDAARLWLFTKGQAATPLLGHWFAHRAIGVTYDPAHEAERNYVPTQLSWRYDAFMFVPRTRPLQAFDWPSGEPRCIRTDSK